MKKSTTKRPASATKKQATTERAVMVTTAHRGVFFGYATNTSGTTIKLRRARNCICWRGLKGFLDLAATGPTSQCRIGAAADIELRDITSVTEVTAEAAAKWESAPWG